ncbi:NADPH-cytochrome P450 reductase [Halenospora varia]|nr:NADPH-cytochrome P450 reductase [Halenospora varia]
MTDVYSLGLKGILQHSQKDDTAFLVFLLLTCIFYTFIFKDKPDPYRHVWFEKPQATDVNVKGADTRDIGQKLEETHKDIVIFWGSQSGTAEGLANRLARDCRSRFGLDALAADLSPIYQRRSDHSDNATQFLSWIDSNKTIQFSQLRYAAFGLGNKKYKFYNRVVDAVVEALDRFGATALMPTGKADDSNGTTDEDFTEWKQSLFSLFRGELGIEERPEQYESTLRVIEDTSLDVIDLHVGEPIKPRGKRDAAAISSIQALPVKSAKKLLSTVDRNCLHVDLDTSEFSELKYKTGDHLARLVNILGLQNRLQIPLLISSLDPSVQVKHPSPTTWEALFQYYLEICAPVPRAAVLSLVQFAPSASSRATLEQLGKDKVTYHSYCSKNHVTLGRLLENVTSPTESWSNLPLSFVLKCLSPLSPRCYSISSSSIVSPKQISIAVATTSEISPTCHIPIPDGTVGPNDPSYNLSGPNNALEQGGKLYAHVRKSKFRLPVLPKNPIIMIASGSGIAPFHGFLSERARLATIGRAVGPSLLFFGCRSPRDFLYQDSLQSLQESNQEMEVIPAFSHTETNGRPGKAYVQDKVQEREEQVVRLLMKENAYFYICGSAGMARDVAARLGESVRKIMEWDEGRLREWSEGMRKTHRWQEDVWG